MLKMQQQALERFDRYIRDGDFLDMDSPEAQAGFLTPTQEKAFDRYLAWVDNQGGFEALDKSSVKKGNLDAVYNEMSHDWTYYSTGDGGEALGEGLYDDDLNDFFRYPWAYPEHPNFKAIYARKFASAPTVKTEKQISEDKQKGLFSSTFDAESPSLPKEEQEDISTVDIVSDNKFEQINLSPTQSFVDLRREQLLEEPRSENDNIFDETSRPRRLREDILRKLFLNVPKSFDNETSVIDQLRQGSFQPFILPKITVQPPKSFVPKSTIENILQPEEDFTDVTTERNVVEELIEQSLPLDFTNIIGEGDFESDFGPVFSPEEAEPFGDFTGAQITDAEAETAGEAFSPGSTPSIFGGTIDTEAEAAAKGPLAQIGRFVDTEIVTPLNLKSESFFTKETAAEEVAKGLVSGVLSGAFPASSAPLGPLGFITPATLITSGLFSAGKAGIDIAQSEFSGFGVGNFISAFFNGLTFGIFGESIAEQENVQEERDLLAEDVFSSGQKGEFDFGKLTPPTTPQDRIQREIELQRELELPFFLDELTGPDGGGPSGITGPTAGLGFSFGSAGVFGLDFDDDSDSGFDTGPSEGGGGVDPGFGGDGEF